MAWVTSVAILRKLFDGVAGADDAAFQNAAQHSAASPEFFSESRTNPLHLVAGRAYHAHLDSGLADSKLLADGEAIYVEARGRDVFEKNAGLKVHRFQSFTVHQQDLSPFAWPCVRTALQADPDYQARFP